LPPYPSSRVTGRRRRSWRGKRPRRDTSRSGRANVEHASPAIGTPLEHIAGGVQSPTETARGARGAAQRSCLHMERPAGDSTLTRNEGVLGSSPSVGSLDLQVFLLALGVRGGRCGAHGVYGGSIGGGSSRRADRLLDRYAPSARGVAHDVRVRARGKARVLVAEVCGDLGSACGLRRGAASRTCGLGRRCGSTGCRRASGPEARHGGASSAVAAGRPRRRRKRGSSRRAGLEPGTARAAPAPRA
jgi:hypothetical protein